MSSLTLVCHQAGEYYTEDGRYDVSLGWSSTECDNPHPVKFSMDLIYLYQSDPFNHKIQDLPFHVRWALQNGQKGYKCEGGVEHWYKSWGVWDNLQDDYVDESSRHFDTKKAAVEWLEDHFAKELA